MHSISNDLCFRRNPSHFIVEGDLIAVRGAVHGKHSGEYAGMPPTGKEVNMDAMMLYQVAEGRILKLWMPVDMKLLWEQ